VDSCQKLAFNLFEYNYLGSLFLELYFSFEIICVKVDLRFYLQVPKG